MIKVAVNYIDSESRADDGRNKTTEGVTSHRDGPAVVNAFAVGLGFNVFAVCFSGSIEEFFDVFYNGLIRLQLQLEHKI